MGIEDALAFIHSLGFYLKDIGFSKQLPHTRYCVRYETLDRKHHLRRCSAMISRKSVITFGMTAMPIAMYTATQPAHIWI